MANFTYYTSMKFTDSHFICTPIPWLTLLLVLEKSCVKEKQGKASLVKSVTTKRRGIGVSEGISVS